MALSTKRGWRVLDLLTFFASQSEPIGQGYNVPLSSIANFLNRYSTGDTRLRVNVAILLSFSPPNTDTSAVQGWSNPIGRHIH